jgi:uncharacterized protein YifE (UPF0438 family)
MQSLKQQHLKLLAEAGKFEVKCSHAIFSVEELEALEQYGHWLQALASGALPPISAAQQRFVEVAQGQRMPVSLHEKAWFKYLGRTKLEAEKGEALKIEYHLLEDSFYSRDMAKQLRRGMRATLSEAHRAG